MKRVNPDLIQQCISKSRPGVVISVVASTMEGRKPEDDCIPTCHLLAIDDRDTQRFEKFFKEEGLEHVMIEVNKSEFYARRS